MAQPDRRYTFAEYLAFERAAETKHEFVNGQIMAMAGGSRRHSLLAARMLGILSNSLGPKCFAFTSDMLIRVLATGRATYPDVSVVCGPIEGDPEDPAKQIVTNPTLIIEVLSPTTERDDRGEKWGHYQRIPALREYIVISQDEPGVERFRRNDAGGWTYTKLTEGSFELTTGGTVDVTKLYADLPA